MNRSHLPALRRRALLAGGTAVLAIPPLAHAQSVLGGASALPAPTPPIIAPVPVAPPAIANAPAAALARTPAAGGAEITVDRAHSAPIPIAMPDLGGGVGARVSQIAMADLVGTGLFRAIDNGSPSEGPVPNFAAWKALGTQALVTGNTSGDGNTLRVEFRLWDVLTGRQIQGTALTTQGGNYRRIAHKIADVVYERLLGDRGYFDTRIVYVAQSGPKDRRVKRLAIMDQDGADNRFLSDGSTLVLTPRFNPTRDQIAFMSYANKRPRVYLFDLASGRQSVLGDFSGITLSPRFSPDGGGIIMAETRGGGSDIVAMGVNGGGVRRLTDSGAIDVSPCYSPDGSQIVFNSDRGGDQQLYLMGAGGGGVRRISFGNGRYASPVWSPRGDLIAFTRLNGGTFAIGVMHPDGSGERILSESYYCDGATFCPNGRVLMFYKETAGSGGTAAIYSVDITGFNERAVITPTAASDPAWSPLLA